MSNGPEYKQTYPPCRYIPLIKLLPLEGLRRFAMATAEAYKLKDGTIGAGALTGLETGMVMSHFRRKRYEQVMIFAWSIADAPRHKDTLYAARLRAAIEAICKEYGVDVPPPISPG